MANYIFNNKAMHCYSEVTQICPNKTKPRDGLYKVIGSKRKDDEIKRAVGLL